MSTTVEAAFGQYGSRAQPEPWLVEGKYGLEDDLRVLSGSSNAAKCNATAASKGIHRK